MQTFLAFWKKDIINKLIVLLGLALMLGVIGLVVVAFFMLPKGKSVQGIYSMYFPTQTPGAEMRMTSAAAERTQISFLATASVPPSPTTMKFTPFAATATPMPSNTPEPVTPTIVAATNTSSGPTDTLTPSAPNATPTLIPRAPTATRALPTSAHPTATRPPSATPTPYPPDFTPPPTSSAPGGLSCLPSNPPQTGKVLSVLDGYTVKVLINGFAYNVRYIGVQLPANKNYALLATVSNNSMAFAKQVTLISDSVDKDAHGYLLRYVLVGDSMPALELLKKGLASTVDIPPNFACAQTFKDAQQAAQSQQSGQWVPTSTPRP